MFLNKKLTFKIPGYDNIRNDHSTGQKRGVAFLVKHGLVINKEYRNNDFSIITENEALAINLDLSNNQNVTLATIYCPNGNPNLSLFHTINNISDNVMFVGDFNSKLESFGCAKKNTSGPMLQNIQNQLNLIYLNSDEHTHMDRANGSTDILDMAFISPNLAKHDIQFQIGDDLGSDHLPIEISIDTPRHRNSSTNHIKYKFDQTDREVFESTLEEALGSADFSGHLSTSDLDKYADFIVTAISTAVNRAIPKSKSVRPESNPISNETLASSIQLGYIPTAWKLATLRMLLKPDKLPSLTTSYRPISLISSIMKLFGRVIEQRLRSHLERIGFINKHQSGFRKAKSTDDHLFRLSQSIMESFNRGEHVVAAFLDVEKAFDNVWHNGLRFKIFQLDLPTKMTRWLSDFLVGRLIQVNVNSFFSSQISPKAGVPQGSVLSPLLFLIYVNDLPTPHHKQNSLSQFADDTAQWAFSRNVRIAAKLLQQDLLTLAKGCAKWRIKLNPVKTKVIIFSRSALARKTELNLKLYGETLKLYPQVKFLGITFDSQLNFKKHFEDILDRCNTRFHRLRLLVNKKWGPSPATLIQIYKQCIRPISSMAPFRLLLLRTTSSAKFSGSKTNLYSLPFVYQNTSALGYFMTPLAFDM